MLEQLEIFLATEQPVTCPYCGARANWLADFSHTNAKTVIQECFNHKKVYLFIIENDENDVYL